jgi:1-acyl-sn-glycerol-3-phosphate acyltransferase
MIVTFILFLFVTFFYCLIKVITTVGKKYNGADWGHPVTNIIDGWLRLYCKKYHRQGDILIPLPINQKLILASNHLSSIDPFLLIAATNRPIRFMIAKEEYNKPILNHLFKAAGCIPVDRQGRVEGAFRSTMRAIKSGELVAIFPQGGIHCKETPRIRIKPGIIKLSHLTECSVLPVRIKGISAPGSMLKCLIKRGNISFDVGTILTTKEVQSEQFRSQISDWLIEKTDKIDLDHP